MSFEQALLFAIPGFFILMLAEYLYGLWKGKDTLANHADTISSLASGLTFISSNTIGFGLLVITYPVVHSLVALGELPMSAPWVWILSFIVMDFGTYWIHRWAHENNFLWSMHLIHHSSEEFNLPVALRQNAFKWFSYGGIMLLPLAIMGVPVELIAIIFPIHYFMQYWYHTQHIGKLGWLEYVIVTPSQHRVHHAINSVYIDRNYGQIFCIWDRLFGTFQQELDEEPCVYGVKAPVKTWNPMRIELGYMWRLLRDAFYTQRWPDKFKVFFSRNGWRPADVAQRFPIEKVQDVRQLQKYQPTLPLWAIFWGWFEIAFTTVAVLYLFATLQSFGPVELAAYVGILLCGLAGITNALGTATSIHWLGLRLLIALCFVALGNGFFGLSSYFAGSQLAVIGLFFITLSLGWLLQRHSNKKANDTNGAGPSRLAPSRAAT